MGESSPKILGFNDAFRVIFRKIPRELSLDREGWAWVYPHLPWQVADTLRPASCQVLIYFHQRRSSRNRWRILLEGIGSVFFEVWQDPATPNEHYFDGHRAATIGMTMLVATRRICIPRDEFVFRFDRSSGPGGQNVNKVNTKVTLRWPVATSPSLPETVRERFLHRFRRRITKNGELVLSSQRYRDQKRNVEDCLEKLRGMLVEVAVAPKQRKATKRTFASQERRLKEKHARSDSKRRRRKLSLED